MKALDKKKVAWKVVTVGSGAIAGLLTHRVLAVMWERSLGEVAPTNPADRRTSWPSALLWAVSTGAAAGVTRLVANRVAAAVWEATTHEAPPGLLPEHAV